MKNIAEVEYLVKCEIEDHPVVNSVGFLATSGKNNVPQCLTVCVSFRHESSRITVVKCGQLRSKASYRSMGTTGDPVPVGQRDVPVNHFTG
jgi:hypothetical protein